MRCRRVQWKLSAYIDGELSAGEYEHILAHLMECPRCREEEEALRRTVVLERVWGVHEAPPALMHRLEPTILARRAASVAAGRRRFGLGALVAPVAGVATAVAALLFAFSAPQPPPGAVFEARNAEAPRELRNLDRTAAAPIAPSLPGIAELGRAARQASPRATTRPWSRVARRPLAQAGSRASRGLALRLADRRPVAVARVAGRPSAARPRSDGRGRRVVLARGPARGSNAARPDPTDERRAAEPIEVAAGLYRRGQYSAAVGVLNAAFEQSSGRISDEERALFRERNALADSTISECSGALRADPGNANARKFLDEAYSAKVALLRSLKS